MWARCIGALASATTEPVRPSVGLPHVRRWATRFLVLLFVSTVLAVVGSAEPTYAHTPHDVISDVAASPSYAQDHTLLAISDAHVLRSTDGGANWIESTQGLGAISHDVEATDTFVGNIKTVTRFAFAPSEPRVVYLASKGEGLYKSTDHGVTWTTTNTPSSLSWVAAVAVSPASPDVVVAAAETSGVFRTVNGGRTWTVVSQTLNFQAMRFLGGGTKRLVASDAKGEVYVSDDEGASFRKAEYSASNGAVTALATASGSSASVVLAGTATGKTFVSDDGGVSWEPAGVVATGDRIQSLIASPTYDHDHTLWASSWHTGAYRSTDGGMTWKPLPLGLTTDPQADLIHSPQFNTYTYAVDSDGVPTLYLGGYDGLFVWSQSAQRWAEIQTQSEYIVGLAVSPNYANDGTVAITTYVKGVFISRDHGDSFVPSDHGLGHPIDEGNKVLPLRRMHNIVFSPAYATDHTIFTATWDRFVKSTDGGETWKQILVQKVPAAENLRQFVIGPSPEYANDGTIYLGTTQGTVYESADRGDPGTWKTIANFGARVRSIAFSRDFSSDHTMFASTENGIRESTDAGSSWKQTGPSGIALLAISPSFAQDHTLFAGTEHGLFVTRDGASSWTQVEGGLPAGGSIAAVAVSPAFANDHTMLVSVAGVGLFRSADGGRSFSPTGASLAAKGMIVTDFDRPTSEPIQFSPDFAADKTVYAYAQENLVRSTDGGSTWQVLTVPSANDFRPSWTGAATRSATTVDDATSTLRVILAVGVAVVVASIVGALIFWRRKNDSNIPDSRTDQAEAIVR